MRSEFSASVRDAATPCRYRRYFYGALGRRFEHRLQLFLDAASESVQKFVSRRYRPWPTMKAKPKVSKGEDSILIWWGGASEAEAVMSSAQLAEHGYRSVTLGFLDRYAPTSIASTTLLEPSSEHTCAI